jgi:hypothetical protein
MTTTPPLTWNVRDPEGNLLAASPAGEAAPDVAESSECWILARNQGDNIAGFEWDDAWLMFRDEEAQLWSLCFCEMTEDDEFVSQVTAASIAAPASASPADVLDSLYCLLLRSEGKWDHVLDISYWYGVEEFYAGNIDPALIARFEWLAKTPSLKGEAAQPKASGGVLAAVKAVISLDGWAALDRFELDEVQRVALRALIQAQLRLGILGLSENHRTRLLVELENVDSEG